MYFPKLSLKNLQKEPINLPDDLHDIAVILVPTQQSQQEECDQWAELIPKLKEIDKSIDFYEMPVLSMLWMWMKPMIDRGMRNGLDKESQKITISFYGRKDRLFQELGFEPGDNVDVLLVYKKQIVAHYTTTEQKSTLLAAVRELYDKPEQAAGIGA